MIGLLQFGTGIGSGMPSPILARRPLECAGACLWALALTDALSSREITPLPSADVLVRVRAPTLDPCLSALWERRDGTEPECPSRTPAAVGWAPAAVGLEGPPVAAPGVKTTVERSPAPEDRPGTETGGSPLPERGSGGPPATGDLGVPDSGALGGALGPDTPTLGGDTLTLGPDTVTLVEDTLTAGTAAPALGVVALTAGVDALTLGVDALTLGAETLTPGTFTPTLGTFTPMLGTVTFVRGIDALALAADAFVARVSAAPSAGPPRRTSMATLASTTRRAPAAALDLRNGPVSRGANIA